MSDQFVAEIRIFAGNFAPKGWAFCNGQLMPISQNTALFSLLGTNYGGDGKSTFGLPDLQGSAPMAPGQGPGLSLHDLGEIGGSTTVNLIDAEMPPHSHFLESAPGNFAANSDVGAGNSFGKSTNGNVYGPLQNPGVQLAPQALPIVGGNLPHNNMMPYLVVNFCVALQGIFPARN